MKHIVGLVVALLVTVAVSVPVFAQGPLSDVPTDHWAYPAVDKLASAGLLEGYPDGTFKGNRALTRYEFAMAIARILEYGDKNWAKGGGGAPVPGPKGDTGDTGPAGAAGPAGPGITPEQQKLLDQLQKEFMPELKELSVRVDELERRVDELEKAPAPTSKIKVSGLLNVRGGWYGSKLKISHGEATGYPFQPFATLPPSGVEQAAAGQYFSDTLFVSDSLKDAFKANDFGTMWTQVNVSGEIKPGVSVMASFVAEPRTNLGGFDDFDADTGLSPNSTFQQGIMDIARVDQAWVKFRTERFLPAEWTVGKQYAGVGEGLLFNDDLYALKAVNGNFKFGKGLDLMVLGASVDREAFGSQSTQSVSGLSPDETKALDTSGQDNYLLGRLALPVLKTWNVGANWLQTGFGDEQGWSVDVKGSIFRRPISAEFATMLRSVGGVKASDWKADSFMGVNDNTAWVVNVGLVDTRTLALSGKYGQVDPLYAFSVTDDTSKVLGFAELPGGVPIFNLPLTLLHPYAEVSPHDINWVDRPLFLDPTNVSKGWEANLTLKSLLGSDMPLKLRWYGGQAYNDDYIAWLSVGGTSSGFSKPEKWRTADQAVVVSVTKPLAEDVNFTLLYGRRETKNVMRPIDDTLRDPIQVVRGELSVAF